MKKTSICASALLSALLLSGNIMTVSAISPNTDSVNTDKNLLIPLDYQRVAAVLPLIKQIKIKLPCICGTLIYKLTKS